MDGCPICHENAQSDMGTDPLLVARLRTGYVRFAPTQYFKGSLFFAAKQCVRELFDLEINVRKIHLEEMAEVSAAANQAFKPRKLNIESLGNGVPHLHWWITPRYDTDPRPGGPIWEDLDFLRELWSKGSRAPTGDLVLMRISFLHALSTRDVTIEFTPQSQPG